MVESPINKAKNPAYLGVPISLSFIVSPLPNEISKKIKHSRKYWAISPQKVQRKWDYWEHPSDYNIVIGIFNRDL